MKAIYFDGKTLAMNADYPKPKSGETLIKVTMSGICGTDLEILKGYMSYCGVLGHEFVGIVEDMVPVMAVVVNVPIETGFPKAPFASLN